MTAGATALLRREGRGASAFAAYPRIVSTASDDDLLLPKPPGLIRRFWGRHMRLADVLLAAAALVAGYLDAFNASANLDAVNPLAIVAWYTLPAIAAAAIVFRRERPLVVLAVTLVIAVILTGLDGNTFAIPALLALYAATVYSRPVYGWVGAALTLGALVAVQYAMTGEPPRNVGVLGVTFVITLLIGSNIGNRRRYLQALLDRASQLARERDQRGQLAAAEERSRIAREMHDVVAHGLSVMIRLSDGAEAVAASDPERSREAVRQIGSVGRSSLRDMRRLLGVLRDDGEVGFAPQPTLDELDDLIETYRSAGLPVAVQQRGTPPTDTTLQVTVYRGVQEGLTNALRYSREPTRVLVAIDYGLSRTTVDIVDNGIFLGAPLSVGSGRGLVGLRERAAAFGGTVEAGPAINPATGQDGGGWRVRMSLPTTLEGVT